MYCCVVIAHTPYAHVHVCVLQEKQLAKGIVPPPKQGKCSACGQSGHVRSNRACPRFGFPDAAEEPAVTASETGVLKLNMKSISAASNAQEQKQKEKEEVTMGCCEWDVCWCMFHASLRVCCGRMC